MKACTYENDIIGCHCISVHVDEFAILASDPMPYIKQLRMYVYYITFPLEMDIA